MRKDTVITVTWMDGKEEVYENVLTYRIADGVLTIEKGQKGFVRVNDPLGDLTLHLVLANIRKYTAQDRYSPD
jgi:hypothetical protein